VLTADFLRESPARAMQVVSPGKYMDIEFWGRSSIKSSASQDKCIFNTFICNPWYSPDCAILSATPNPHTHIICHMNIWTVAQNLMIVILTLISGKKLIKSTFLLMFKSVFFGVIS
jgi:hypothetical protein